MATISSTISLVDNITSKLESIKGKLDEVAGSFESLESDVNNNQSSVDNFNWDTFIKNCESAGEAISGVGKKMTLAISTPLVLLGKKMYTAATDYESAFAGVRKTTEATEEEFQALYDGMIRMSKTETSVGFVDLSGIMEIAGQTGVVKENLLDFTKTFADLQVSTDIGDDEGAKNLARFLNLTEKSTDNVARLGGVIVELGNNFATSESEILSMATRMAATGDLAGFTATEILGLATALSSAGINAEAGGSAAGKLMKQMQLAAEMGAEAEKYLSADYGNPLDFSYYISSNANLLAVAQDLGQTTDYVQKLGENWLLLDQFAKVSGKTADQFRSDWVNNPAQGMLDFFVGLGNLDSTGQQSVLSMLSEMGITEIRLSNLVAAMAGNSELYSKALEMAYSAYMQDVDINALAVEAGQRYGTQESQNAMLGNKLKNTMADFGDNLVQALQPALDLVNELLTAFNSLSETDQTIIIELLGAAAVAGPAITALGTTIKTFTTGYSVIKKFAEKAPDWGAKIGDFFTNPAYWGTAAVVGAAATGIYLLVDYISNMKTDLEVIREGALNIPISIDESQYSDSLSKIQQIQDALNGLKAGEVNQEYENTSAAVSLGYGTQDMFDTALAYQSSKTSATINEIASEYAAKMNAAQKKIVDLSSIGDEIGADAALGEYRELEVNLNLDLASARENFATQISELFNGMARQYPEEAKVFENAVNQYELLYNLGKRADFSWIDNVEKYGEEGADKISSELNDAIFGQAFKLGYISEYDYNSYLQKTMGNPDLWLSNFGKQVESDLSSGLSTLSGNPIFSTWLQTILDNAQISENLDTSNLSGAFAGVFELIKYRGVLEQAAAAGEIKDIFDFLVEPMKQAGEDVSAGLGEGITSNVSAATEAASSMGGSTIEAVNAALGVQSPSVLMIESGINVDEGLAIGITSGMGSISAAISGVSGSVIAQFTEMCTTVISVGSGTLSYGAGYSMGSNIGSGMAAGIRSQIGAVSAAVSALANAAASAARNRLQIHSPSRVFYGFGEMSGMGYINALDDMTEDVERAVGRLLEHPYTAVNEAVWNGIDLFSGLENEDFLNADTENYEVKVSDSDMKKIRELAEREVINQFTTAELHIDFTANNKIDSTMDLDKVVEYLEDKVAERLEFVAEGVY